MRKASGNVSQEAVLFGMGMDSDTKNFVEQLFLRTQKKTFQKHLKYFCSGLIHSQ